MRQARDQRELGHRRRRRPARVLPALVLALALLTGALGAPATAPPDPSAPPSPVLRTASLQDPVPPTNVQATGGDQRLNLSWTASSEGFVSGYRVYLDGVLRASPTGTSATITGLVNGRDYAVTVSTVTSFVTTYEGTTRSTPVTGTPHNGIAPAAPVTFTASGADRSVALSWTAVADPELRGYELRRGGTLVTTTAAGATSYTDTGRTNGVTYTYSLVAVDAGGLRSTARTASALARDSVPPSAPTGVVASSSNGYVTITWTPNPEYDVAAYRIWRNGTQVATVPGTSWTDTALTNGDTYAYQVQAIDTSGNESPATTPVPATPNDGLPPAAPAGFTATAGDGQVLLGWTASTDPEVRSHELRRDGVLIATPGAAVTTWTDAGLTNGVLHTYTLVAVDVTGARSPAVTATARPADTDPPVAPTGLMAVPGDARISLSWSPNAEDDIASYVVYRDGAEVASVSGLSWVDTGVANGVEHEYRLAARDSSGNLSPRSAVAVRVTAHDGLPPAAPAGFAATPGDRQVALAWTASADPEVRGYELRRDGTLVASLPPATTSWTDTGRVNGVAYAYALVAVDVAAEVSAPATASATPRDADAPAAPTMLVATPGDGTVALSWSRGSEYDLAYHRVLRDGVEVAVVVGGSWTDTGLVKGRTYAYTVVAVDTSANASPPSAAVTAVPRDAVPPAAPTGLAATPGDRQVQLSWTAPADPDITAYRVWRDGVQVAVVTATGWTDTGLVNGRAYTYAVNAVDTSGNDSPPSAGATTIPVDADPPAAPTGLAAEPGDRTVALSWTAVPEYDVVDYRVLRDGAEVAVVTGTSWTDSGRANGTPSTYTVVAVDTSGLRSPPSDPVTATPTSPDGPPAAPAGLMAVAGDGQVALTWAANGESDLDGYVLLRGGVEIATTDATSYTDTAVVNGTTHTYTLVAVDTSANRSPASDPVTATPVPPAPPAPTGVSATAGDARAVVSWSAAGSGVVAHRVLRGDGTVAVEVAAPATRAGVTGLANGTTYRFTVVAVDAWGRPSAPSAEVSVVPVAGAPSVPADGAGASGGVAVSADGQVLVVGTRARLEASDTNTAYELYLVDRDAGTRRRIAPLAASATGSADPTNTSAPAVSDDGRYVALATTQRLLPADTNTLADVYRLDTRSGTWALVSVPASGAVSAGTAGTLLQPGPSVAATSPSVAVSANGDLVLFYSARADLVTGDTNGLVDLFAKRMSTGAVTRVSTTATGGNLTRQATGPALALTPDGRFALFPAASASGSVVLYRKTLSGAGAGELSVVSTVGSTEFAVYRDAGDVAISDDGRYVALVTAAQVDTSTPTAGYSTGFAYRKDVVGGALVGMGSGQRTIWEHRVELDPSGRYGFFSTAAAALPADTNARVDFYRRDLDGGVAGPLVLVTAGAGGAPTGGPSGSVTAAEYGRAAAVSGDRVLLLTSQALVPADTNGLRDLYSKDLASGSVGGALG